MASKKKNDFISSSASKASQQPSSETSPMEEYMGMKFLGVDYFRVIYVSVSVLIILMLIVYLTAEDETL